MLSAVIFGLVGIFSTAILARQVFDWEMIHIVQSIVASNIAALVALQITLKGERTKWVRRRIFRSSRFTWPIFSLMYFSILVIGAPFLLFKANTVATEFQFKPLLVLSLPLIWSTGFVIILFGPLQDLQVRRLQKKAALKEKE